MRPCFKDIVFVTDTLNGNCPDSVTLKTHASRPANDRRSVANGKSSPAAKSNRQIAAIPPGVQAARSIAAADASSNSYSLLPTRPPAATARTPSPGPPTRRLPLSDRMAPEFASIREAALSPIKACSQ